MIVVKTRHESARPATMIMEMWGREPAYQL